VTGVTLIRRFARRKCREDHQEASIRLGVTRGAAQGSDRPQL